MIIILKSIHTYRTLLGCRVADERACSHSSFFLPTCMRHLKEDMGCLPNSQEPARILSPWDKLWRCRVLKLNAQEVPVGFLQHWPCRSLSPLSIPLLLTRSLPSPLLWWAPWDLRGSDKGSAAFMWEEAEEWVSQPPGSPARVATK